MYNIHCTVYNTHGSAFETWPKCICEREGANEKKDIDSVCLRGVIGCISEWKKFEG